MKNGTEQARWRFNGGEVCTLEISGRIVRCYEGATVAWTNSFRSSAAARSRYEGDLRAMRKNDCYAWLP